LLLVARLAAGGGDEGQRFLALDVEADAGVLGAEGGRPVRPLAATAVAGRHAEDGILWQGLVERAQAVADPRADGRVGALADVPARVPLELGAVVIVGGPQGANHGEVVGTAADVLPPVGDHEAGLAVLLPAGVQAHELFAAAVGGVGADEALEALRIQ